jgi:hypothetical protein
MIIEWKEAIFFFWIVGFSYLISGALVFAIWSALIGRAN